jgi:hypothetical protein
MSDLTAKRTLVKSPPELWEELSEVDRLAKHLGAFGEIRITRLEPEHTVAWEGEHASGTVSIEPSGWGTKVTLQAELPGVEEPAEPDAAEPEPEPPEQEPPETRLAAPEPVPAAPEPVHAAPEPEAVTEAEAPEAFAVEPEIPRPRRGFWAWLFRTRTGTPAGAKPEPSALAAAEPAPSAVAAAEPAPEAVREAEPELEAVAAVEPEPEAVAAVEPEPEAVAAVGPEPQAVGGAEPGAAPAEAAAQADSPPQAPVDRERARLILDEALDALGAAHHRPFSRA